MKNLKIRKVILLCLLSSVFLVCISNNLSAKTKKDYCDHYIEDWLKDNRVVAHALGGIDGKSYTNSIDALKYNYEHGKRIFETDFTLSADGTIILTHDWEETTKNLIDYPPEYIPTYEEFSSNRIYYKYKPTSALELLTFMNEHEDMYLISDIKYSDQATINVIMQGLVDLAKANHYENVLDNFIVQFYFEQNYYDLQAIYPFENWIYALYAEKIKDFESVKNFCLLNTIPAVQMSYKWVKDDTTLQVFNDNGIEVYVYTLNNLTKVFEMIDYGVYGFYSDFLENNDLYLQEEYTFLPKLLNPLDISKE